MDTLIFRRFDAGSNFQTAKDTIFINNINVLWPSIQGDSVILNTGTSRARSLAFAIEAGYDYEIFIPGVNKLVRISDIQQTNEKRKSCSMFADGNDFCLNSLLSYNVNGETKTTEYIYIKK